MPNNANSGEPLELRFIIFGDENFNQTVISIKSGIDTTYNFIEAYSKTFIPFL